MIGLIDCSFEQPFRCVYELVGTHGVIEVPDAYLPPARPVAWVRVGGGTEEVAFVDTNQYGVMVDAFSEVFETDVPIEVEAKVCSSWAEK